MKKYISEKLRTLNWPLIYRLVGLNILLLILFRLPGLIILRNINENLEYYYLLPLYKAIIAPVNVIFMSCYLCNIASKTYLLLAFIISLVLQYLIEVYNVWPEISVIVGSIMVIIGSVSGNTDELVMSGAVYSDKVDKVRNLVSNIFTMDNQGNQGNQDNQGNQGNQGNQDNPRSKRPYSSMVGSEQSTNDRPNKMARLDEPNKDKPQRRVRKPLTGKRGLSYRPESRPRPELMPKPVNDARSPGMSHVGYNSNNYNNQWPPASSYLTSSTSFNFQPQAQPQPQYELQSQFQSRPTVRPNNTRTIDPSIDPEIYRITARMEAAIENTNRQRQANAAIENANRQRKANAVIENVNRQRQANPAVSSANPQRQVNPVASSANPERRADTVVFSANPERRADAVIFSANHERQVDAAVLSNVQIQADAVVSSANTQKETDAMSVGHPSNANALPQIDNVFSRNANTLPQVDNAFATSSNNQSFDRSFAFNIPKEGIWKNCIDKGFINPSVPSPNPESTQLTHPLVPYEYRNKPLKYLIENPIFSRENNGKTSIQLFSHTQLWIDHGINSAEVAGMGRGFGKLGGGSDFLNTLFKIIMVPNPNLSISKEAWQYFNNIPPKLDDPMIADKSDIWSYLRFKYDSAVNDSIRSHMIELNAPDYSGVTDERLSQQPVEVFREFTNETGYVFNIIPGETAYDYTDRMITFMREKKALINKCGNRPDAYRHLHEYLAVRHIWQKANYSNYDLKCQPNRWNWWSLFDKNKD